MHFSPQRAATRCGFICPPMSAQCKSDDNNVSRNDDSSCTIVRIAAKRFAVAFSRAAANDMVFCAHRAQRDDDNDDNDDDDDDDEDEEEEEPSSTTPSSFPVE